MLNTVPPAPSRLRRHGRNAIVGMTAAGIILTGPTAAFASEATAEQTGTFGQEIDPATGAPATADATAYPVVEQVAAEAVAAEQAPVAAFADTVAPVPAETTADAETAEAVQPVEAAQPSAPEAPAAAEPVPAAAAPEPTLAPAVLAPATAVVDPFVALQVAAADTVADPDTDGDGVPDSQDAYPADPTNTAPAPQPAPATDADGDGLPDDQDPYPADPTNTAPAPEPEPAPVDGGAAAPVTPTQTAYNDESTTVEVPEQYRGADSGFTFVLVGADGQAVPVSLDDEGRAVLTPEALKDLAGGTYTLRAVQGADGATGDISVITLVDPVSAPVSELAPTVTTGSDLIGTIGDYSKGQKILVRDAGGKVVEGLKITISDNGFYVVEGLGDGGYTLEVVSADGTRLTERAPVTLTAPAEGESPQLSTPENVTAGKDLAIGGTGYETHLALDEDGTVKSYGTVKVKITDPVTGKVVDEKVVELKEDGSFDYAFDTTYSAGDYQRLVITVTERDGTSTTRTEVVTVEGNGTPVVTAPNVVQGKSPAIGGTQLIPGESYTFQVSGPGRDSTVTLVAGEDGKVAFRMADDLRPGDYTVKVTNANGAPVPGQGSDFTIHADRDGDGIPDYQDNWDGPGANEPDSDGDGIPDSRDNYYGPGANAPIVIAPAPTPVKPVPPVFEDPQPSIPGIELPGQTPGQSPDGGQVPGETPGQAPGQGPDNGQSPVVTVPIGDEPSSTPADGSLGVGTPLRDGATPSTETPVRGTGLTVEPVSLIEKILGGGQDRDSSGPAVVNNLEQRLDASPLRDAIEKATGLNFSRDLSERGNFQAAPNLGDVLERVTSATPGLDADPVPVAAGATDDGTDAPEAIDLRDAAPRAAEQAGGLQASDAFGPAGLAVLGLVGLGAVAGTYFVVVRRGAGQHRA